MNVCVGNNAYDSCPMLLAAGDDGFYDNLKRRDVGRKNSERKPRGLVIDNVVIDRCEHRSWAWVGWRDIPPRIAGIGTTGILLRLRQRTQMLITRHIEIFLTIGERNRTGMRLKR